MLLLLYSYLSIGGVVGARLSGCDISSLQGGGGGGGGGGAEGGEGGEYLHLT